MQGENNGADEPVEIGGLEIQPGDRIGPYVFIRELGSGGMARILLASAPDGGAVALKVLRPNRFKTGLVRFRREFRALSRIRHPNVIRVDAYGDLHGHPYIAMEYVDGPDLHTVIRGWRNLPVERRYTEAEQVLVQLCRALAAIHKQGLVHRDLKPSNVLVTQEGTCKLTDFGIVKDLDPSQDPNVSTTLVGTWAYASPEQITGQPIDHRSDLYSLGVILFAMLTGKRPFVAKDMAGYLTLHRDKPAPSPSDVDPTVPPALDEICRRLLQKSPRDRFQSAQDILYRLEADERPTAATPVDTEGWEPPIVGRALEIEAAGECLAALTDGRGGAVAIEGEDGAGKSRLLDAIADKSAGLGFTVHRVEMHADAPVFSAMLRLGDVLSRELGVRTPPALTATIEAYTRGAAMQGDARYALWDGIREALVLSLEGGPRVLLIDDLHEAHPREVDLCGYLLRTLVAPGREDGPQALLVVFTLRSKANPTADALASGRDLGFEPREIQVGPLAVPDVERIAASLLGPGEAARRLAIRLHAETEGNAFFVAEFFRSLLTKGLLRRHGAGFELAVPAEQLGEDHLEIPPGIRQMLRARLQHLPPLPRRTLEILSISGRELELDVLLDVLDVEEDAALDAIDVLMAAGIVVERKSGEQLWYAVAHRKFADVVYRDLSPERRSGLHRQVAAGLELHKGPDAASLEIIGEHYRRSGDAGSAYRYLVAAAKRLADKSLTQEAWELSQKAGAIEESAREELSAEEYRRHRRDDLEVRAIVRYNRAEWAESATTWAQVLQLAEQDQDARAACRARLRLATVLRRKSKVADSRRYAEEGLETARRLHYREGVAEALHCLASIAWAEGDLAECERFANEGLLVAQGGALADMRAELLLALTAAQATRGQLAAATSGLEEAEAIFRDLRMKRPRCLALCNIAELLTWQGEPLEARQRARAALQLADELDYKLGRTAALRASSVAALDLGLIEEAQRGLEAALVVANEIQLTEEALACLVALTQLALDRLDLAAARKLTGQGLELAVIRDPERYMPMLRVQLARALSPSRVEDAKTLLRAVEDELPRLPVPRRTMVLIALATAWAVVGDEDLAVKHLRVGVQLAEARGFKLVALEGRALWASLSTGEDRERQIEAARQIGQAVLHKLPPDLAATFRARPVWRLVEPRADATPIAVIEEDGE